MSDGSLAVTKMKLFNILLPEMAGVRVIRAIRFVDLFSNLPQRERVKGEIINFVPSSRILQHGDPPSSWRKILTVEFGQLFDSFLAVMLRLLFR